MKIIIKNLQGKITINPASIRKIAKKVNPPPRLNNLKLSLYFVENLLIKKLNQQFFKKNRLTDVISFNLGNDYAEVFIAPCVVKSNSAYFGASFKEELYRCTIHGILHVFGYNDENSKERSRMWKRQESILKKILVKKPK
ncbi:MAG: rRNA maturation RNase YbeY [Candidatus Omnitrophica bacterium]|nr:rRNA maturation RNase YbeY [Candidatus Omnitrophota bacterium]MDD5352523.1 rRNA maturation RNase YbeY [Candidatus Omnitrophota bacterium]MDD5550121.1 rRNA maturation RNase YbeY [Candidatus Omnitrophota bacterium]